MTGKSYTNLDKLNFLRYYYGIYYSSSSSNNTITSATCNSNGYYGIYYSSSSSNNTITSATCNSNGSYGIYYSSSINNTIYALSTTGNTTAAIYANNANNICHFATIAESTKVAIGTTYYANTRQYINNLGGYSYVYSILLLNNTKYDCKKHIPCLPIPQTINTIISTTN